MAAKKSPPASKATKAPKAAKTLKAPKAPKAPKVEKAAIATKAPKAPKASKAPKAVKAIKEVLNKTELAGFVSEQSGVETKEVKKVLAALESAVAASVSKKGAGSFVLPGVLKINVVKVPAKPKRKGLNRFTGQEQWFAAKPASTKVKIRPLKKLKDAAA